MYNITKIGALQLAARYDAVVRYNLIERVMKLSKNETISSENIALDPKKVRLQKALDDLEYTLRDALLKFCTYSTLIFFYHETKLS